MYETEIIRKEDLVLYPFSDLDIETLHIKRNINEHGKMTVVGIMNLPMQDNYYGKLGDEIKLTSTSNDEKVVLFQGLLTSISLDREEKSNKCSFTFECETASHMLDIKANNCSFHNVKKTYKNLINHITKKYENVVIDFKLEDKEIDGLIIQYNETDWEFIKRMASQFEVGLYQNFDDNKAKISFGKPSINNNVIIDEKTITIRHNVQDNILECDFKSSKLLELGEYVINRDIGYFVKSIELELLNDELIINYTTTTSGGLKQARYENENIKGTLFSAKVIDVSDSKVKVTLTDFQGFEDKELDYWFSYSSICIKANNAKEYGLIPKIGDDVFIHNT